MFAGIVEGTVAVTQLDKKESGLVLGLAPLKEWEKLPLGASVAINGVCLTVVANKKGALSFEVIPETVRKTTLSALEVGSFVNYERSLKVGDSIDGHFVFGHVDATARLSSKIQESENSYRLRFAIPKGIAKFLAPKGSIALSGVSLTLGEVSETHFTVYLAPYTIEKTIFKDLQIGERVNVEVDMLARYVERLLAVEPDQESFAKRNKKFQRNVVVSV